MHVPRAPGPRRGGGTHPESCCRTAAALFRPVRVSCGPALGCALSWTPVLSLERALWPPGPQDRALGQQREQERRGGRGRGAERKAGGGAAEGPQACPPRVFPVAAGGRRRLCWRPLGSNLERGRCDSDLGAGIGA